MITMEIGCTNTLSCSITNIKSIAYDGCDYAALCDNRVGITRLDEKFCSLGTYGGSYDYACICFDRQACCYYAFAKQQPTLLYVLDLNFEILETLDITTHHPYCPCVISVSPMESILYLLFEDEIVVWDKLHDCIIKTICIEYGYRVLDMIALQHGYILCYEFDKKTYMEVVCSFCDPSQVFCMPCEYEFHAMILTQLSYDDCCCCIELQMLMSSCYEQITYPLYITCATDELPPVPSHLTCEGGKNEIIHSIALEEAGIAHILNAEGEKLQKAVASDITIEELLMVNESVRRTITQVTILEGQLYSKLESLHCLCADETNENK